MSFNLSYLDQYPRLRQAELLRESELVRLADLAAGPRRPFRSSVADWLVAAADWIEGSSRRRILHALEQ